MANKFGFVSLMSGANSVNIYAGLSVSSTYSLRFPNVAPANTQQLRWDSVNSTFIWVNPTTVSSLETFINVSLVGTDYQISIPDQTARHFLAADGSGVVAFRAVVDADITALSASKLTGIISPANLPGVEQTFINADIVADALSVTHNFNTRNIDAWVMDPSFNMYNVDVTATSVNAVSLGLGGLTPITGTWTAFVNPK